MSRCTAESGSSIAVSTDIVNFDSAESCSPLFQQERLPQVMPSLRYPLAQGLVISFYLPLLIGQQPFILQPNQTN